MALPAGTGQGNLFHMETAVAILVGLHVLVRGSWRACAAAVFVAASGVPMVLPYRYVDVPAFGPFPAMDEPVWSFEKSPIKQDKMGDGGTRQHGCRTQRRPAGRGRRPRRNAPTGSQGRSAQDNQLGKSRSRLPGQFIWAMNPACVRGRKTEGDCFCTCRRVNRNSHFEDSEQFHP